MVKINRDKYYFVGNWKMNKSFSDLESFIKSIYLADCHQWIAPQMVHLHALKEMTKMRSPLKVGSQNHCHELTGAFTGESSIEELQEIGVDFTIVGHSERRQFFNETNETVAKKVKLSLERGIPSILCVGETLEQRESGKTLSVIEEQLEIGLSLADKNSFKYLLLAYEPVWAIGTGQTATPEQAQDVHEFIRKKLSELINEHSHMTPILYGGSVKPENVENLMKKQDIDGALIGGASLNPESYNSLCKNGPKQALSN